MKYKAKYVFPQLTVTTSRGGNLLCSPRVRLVAGLHRQESD
jgi:hypothetical protein